MGSCSRVLLFQLLVSLQVVFGAVPSIGSCPNIRGISNFDRSKYLGSWYEYSNVFEFYQIGSSCVRATYTDEGERIGVFNENVNTITGRYGNVKGNARPANNEGRGEFIVGFAGVPFGNGDGGGRANYMVVDTDYDTYAIVYSCAPKLFIKKESLWLLTRVQHPTRSLVNWAYKRMTQLGLPVGSLAKTEQNQCNKLPPAGAASPSLTIESLG